MLSMLSMFKHVSMFSMFSMLSMFKHVSMFSMFSKLTVHVEGIFNHF